VHSRESTFFPGVLQFCFANYRNCDLAANSETSDRRNSSYRTRSSFVRATRTGKHWLEYELDKYQRNAKTWDKNHTETIYTHEIQTTSQERRLKGQGRISSGHKEKEKNKRDSAHYKRVLVYCFLSSLSKHLIANIHCNNRMIRVQ
jgi:hypothetical protein